MKHVLFTLCFLWMSISQALAQPQNTNQKSMSYQAIIRNGTQGLIVNGTVAVRVSIIKDSEFGVPVYVETHKVKTNANGLITLSIGTGVVLLGKMDSIEWANGPYFLRTETDPLGGSEFGITTISQIQYIPYAFLAEKSLIADSVLAEHDPMFMNSIAKGIKTEDTASWNAKLDEEIDPKFSAWTKDYNDLTNKPVTNGSETKIVAGRNISVSGKGTDSLPYVISSGASILKILVADTNVTALQTLASTIIAISDNDGNADKFSLPTNAEQGQVMYMIHKTTGNQADSIEINGTTYINKNYTFVFADGEWNLMSAR